MDVRRINDDLVEYDGRVRIERGPVRLTATATEALLSDIATAGHYKAGAPDALGKPIVLGQPMTYIDWVGQTPAWYVYRLETVATTDKAGDEVDVRQWVEKSVHADDAAAQGAAFALLA